MIIAHCYLDVPAENRDAYYAELNEKVGIPTRAEKGCLQYDYLFPRERDDLIVLIERWTCQEDMDAHLQSSHIQMTPQLRAKYGVKSTLYKYSVSQA